MERDTLTILKACEVVGVSRRTIYNWINAGKVEYIRTAGGSIRIFADTLWRSVPPPAPPPRCERTSPMFPLDEATPAQPAFAVDELRQPAKNGCPTCGVVGGGHLRECPRRVN